MTQIIQDARGAAAFHTPEDFRDRVGDTTRNVVDGKAAIRSAWDALIDELLSIRGYKDDWDGEGSQAPHPALVDAALKLALALKGNGSVPADRVVAGVNATVTFEWFAPEGYTEIEVSSPLDAEMRRIVRGADKAEVYRLVRFW
ncbi:MAG: hypothetical protein K2W96_17245 [Gemmataceae bacterium]|nr:hypothetical protein [Gemmataceae bacterium]